MKEVKIVDVTIPRDERLNEREVGKIEKHKLLKDEISRMWDMKEGITLLLLLLLLLLFIYLFGWGVSMSTFHFMSWILKSAIS